MTLHNLCSLYFAAKEAVRSTSKGIDARNKTRREEHVSTSSRVVPLTKEPFCLYFFVDILNSQNANPAEKIIIVVVTEYLSTVLLNIMTMKLCLNYVIRTS